MISAPVLLPIMVAATDPAFDFFQAHMIGRSDIGSAEFAGLRGTATVRNLRKHQYLLQAGDVWKSVAFVCKGCLRMYGVDEHGEEHILRFSAETWWATDGESYTTGQPSKFHIDALEDCELLVWTKHDFESMIATMPGLRRYVDELMRRNANAISQRIYASISSSAEEKYQAFLAQYPDLAQRVPLRMMASYLGVSRETLSRVRKKLLRS